MASTTSSAFIMRTMAAAGILLIAGTVGSSAQNSEVTNLRPDHAKNMCLTFAPKAKLAACDGSDAQKITMTRLKNHNGQWSLKVGSQCVEASNREGDPLFLAKCETTLKQMWRATNTGELKNSGIFCVDVARAGKTAGTPVIVYRCNGNQNQLWARYSPKDASQGSADITHNQMITPKSAPGKCLEVGGHANSQVYITDCKGSAAQKFSFRWERGAQIQVNNRCLSHYDGQIVRAGECDRNRSDQRWNINTNGEFRSPNGKCMDVKENSLRNGTWIILYQCTNQANQRFYVRR